MLCETESLSANTNRTGIGTVWSSTSVNERLSTTFRRDRALIPAQQFLERFDREVTLRHRTHFGEELIVEDGQIWLRQAPGGEAHAASFGGDGPPRDVTNRNSAPPE